MKKISDILLSAKSFKCRNGISINQICEAEDLLQLFFSEEFKDYLVTFGEASVYGHELTGICDSKRLNVVDVTIEERQNNPDIPANYYVIEQANIDGIVIWQSETGEIFQSMPGSPTIKLCNSLCEYIDI